MTDESGMKTNSQPLPPFLQQLAQLIAECAEGLASVLRAILQDEQFQEVLQSIVLGVEAMVFWEWIEKACSHSGYLPYRTVPFDEFYHKSEDNYELFSSLVLTYYESKQEEILKDIESRLDTLENVDMDRKEALQEAIMAHRYGLFRLPPLALLPSIERIILEDWMGRDRGKIETLNERKIREIVVNKRLEEVMPDGIYDSRLFGCLINVLYKNGGKLKEFEGENLPNRHAALHGWLPYSTKEYSLNTIIFSNYIIRLVPVFKKGNN